jgi:SAM-dependent methyltransferase
MVRRLEPKDLPHQFGGSPEEVGRNLDSLTKANRYFGGVRSLARPLHGLLLRHRGRPVRLLDVGCGRAEAARRHVEWARAQGIDLRVTVVDRDADVIAQARRGCAGYPEIRIVRGDALGLPFRAGTFDYVSASMLLHYFGTEEAAGIVRGWAALAGRAVIVSDVRRHWFPCAAISVLSRLSGSPLFGQGSRRTVLRGFTPAELRGLARAAALGRSRLTRHFRLALVGFVSAD